MPSNHDETFHSTAIPGLEEEEATVDSMSCFDYGELINSINFST